MFLMKAGYAAVALGVLVILAYFVGRLFAFVGFLPHVGYVLTGSLFGAGLTSVERGYLFLYAFAFLLAYLGYMASSRRTFSAPLQLFFVHPLRLVVGFALFFTVLYFAGVGIEISAIAALLLSTSSALVVRWGRGTSYALIEHSLLAMDALISALVLLYVAGEPFHSILVAALAYLLLMYSGGPILSSLVFIAVAALATGGHVGYLALAFVFGVVFHHLVYDLKLHWAEGAIQDVLPIVFLVGIGAWAGTTFPPAAGILFVVIAFLSLLQNFISLVVLGSVFGVSPKTGAHILARTFGPSEASLFALALLAGQSPLFSSVFWFYVVSLAFSSFVRTEKDAEHLLSVLLPKGLFQTIERLEAAYASLYVRHHVVFSSAYRHRFLPLARKMLGAIIVLVLAASSLGYLMFDNSIPYRAALIFLAVSAFVIALLRVIVWYMQFYFDTLLFLSDHAYGGKLRPGNSPYYFVAGFLLTIAGFATLPISVPFLNLVLLFFSLILLNAGLYMLLTSYTRLYNEFVRKREYG
ncbi:MAG: hypothetical protein PWP76_4 [Candidatus Diapherotrites archaeon]|nr:hypothetical protein [Candidatus Diapherotrites archaeon]MDN5366678.1 hypothetical protein [Candidatus Diapherotrites archaeon]